jgi:hypothetical protein
MAREIVGTGIVGLVYFCCLIVIFSPTIYVCWLYVIGRKVEGKARGLGRLSCLTFAINLMVAYFLIKLAFEGFLVNKVAEWQNVTVAAIGSAVAAEKRHFQSHGKYYAVGPVRGPYSDQYGLSVNADVILEVVPSWDSALKRETFRVYAVHVLAKKLIEGSGDGKVAQAPPESRESQTITSKLFNSVK